MADYYPLLSRAIAGLAGKPDADRHAIYGRAREALERQLRGFEPAIEEAGIRAELDALEATITRIEMEQAAPLTAIEAALLGETPAPSEPINPTKDAAEEVPAAEAQAKASPAPDLSVAETPPASSVTGPSPFKALRPTVNDLPPKDDLRSRSEPFAKVEPPVEEVTETDVAPAAPEAAAIPEMPVPDAPPLVDPAEEALALQPMLRPRIPSRREEDKAGRKKPLALFAGIAIVAMMVMGLVALTRRDTAEPNRVPPVVVAPEANPDASKTEGRLANSDAPAKPLEQKDPAPAGGQPQKPDDASRTTPPVQEARPATPPAAAVIPAGNRAFMVLEVPGGAPNQFEGKTAWSFAPDPSLKGQKTLRTLIDFPTGGLSVDLSIARNSDPAIGFSHTVMVIFDTKNVESIREMSAIEWRERESQAGTVLAGIVVPIQDNVFMLGLDKADAALARNLDLLRTQKWMVFEVRLVNGRRGAVLVEKGGTGDKAIADALAEWK